MKAGKFTFATSFKKGIRDGLKVIGHGDLLETEIARYWLFDELEELEMAIENSTNDIAYELIDVIYVFAKSPNSVVNMVEFHLAAFLSEVMKANLSIRDLLTIGCRKWCAPYEDRKSAHITAAEAIKFRKIDFTSLIPLLKLARWTLTSTTSKNFIGANYHGYSRMPKFSIEARIAARTRRKKMGPTIHREV